MRKEDLACPKSFARMAPIPSPNAQYPQNLANFATSKARTKLGSPFFRTPTREAPAGIHPHTSRTREASVGIFPETSRTREASATKFLRLRGFAWLWQGSPNAIRILAEANRRAIAALQLPVRLTKDAGLKQRERPNLGPEGPSLMAKEKTAQLVFGQLFFRCP
jgi:hypothetical protein